jgi:hypothetical protein
LTRHSHYARVRLGGLTIWRIQCTRCRAVFTVLPHFVLRYRRKCLYKINFIFIAEILDHPFHIIDQIAPTLIG